MLRMAQEAARHSTEMAPEPGSRFDDRDSWQQIGPFGGSAAPRLQGLIAMEEPHCRPFRRMITDPRVTQRLTWMMGTHYTIAALPNAIVSVDGAAGVYLHAGGTHVDPTNVYSVVSGLSLSLCLSLSLSLCLSLSLSLSLSLCEVVKD